MGVELVRYLRDFLVFLVRETAGKVSHHYVPAVMCHISENPADEA
jgi:hypothetical protein